MRNTEYGFYESNPVNAAQQGDYLGQAVESVDWATKGLKITRLRLLGDSHLPGYDVSYCWGVLNGKPVHVDLPFFQLRNRKTWKSEVIEYAKKDGVFAKGLGIFDPLVVSVLS